MSELGAYILRHRSEKNLSVRKLATLANISHSEIHRIEHEERKNPSPLLLKAIAGALGVSYTDILEAAGYVDKPALDKKPDLLLDVEGLNEQEVQEVRNFIDFLRNKKKGGYSI